MVVSTQYNRSVLGAIAQLAAPDLAVRDRSPQLANELLRVKPRIEDPVILADQLLARVLRDLAELVVDVYLIRPGTSVIATMADWSRA